MRRSHVSSLHTRRGLGGVGAEQAEQDCSGQWQAHTPNGNPTGCSANQPATASRYSPHVNHIVTLSRTDGKLRGPQAAAAVAACAAAAVAAGPLLPVGQHQFFLGLPHIEAVATQAGGFG